MGLHAKHAVNPSLAKIDRIVPLRIAIGGRLCHKACKIPAATGATAA